MKKSNLFEYNLIFEQLQKIGDRFVAALFPEGIPPAVYEITGFYDVREVPIIKASYSLGDGKNHFYREDKRVSNDHLNAIRSYRAVIGSTLDRRNVGLDFSYQREWLDGSIYTVSGRYKLGEIDGINKSFVRSDLDGALLERRIKYELKPGDIRCCYCHRATPEATAVHYSVINFKQYGRGGNPGLYCSEQCAGYAQMASEG